MFLTNKLPAKAGFKLRAIAPDSKCRSGTFYLKNSCRLMLAASVLLIQSCSSLGIQPVSEDNKIQSGDFDGQWLVTVTDTPAKVQLGNSVLVCADRSGLRWPMVVEDGKIAMPDRDAYTFVDKEGGFKLIEPIEITVTRDGFEEAGKGGELILTASLKNNSGRVQWTSQASSGRGCQSKVRIERV